MTNHDLFPCGYSTAALTMMSGSQSRNAIVFVLIGLSAALVEAAQPPDPQIGYIYPPGAAAGSEVEIRLGGFNWTPDLEFFVHDDRVRLDVTGELSPMFLPGAPYLVGTKAYYPPPMPREVSATLRISEDMPPGPVHWQVANASGTSQIGVFVVGDQLEMIEDDQQQLQRIERFPVTVSGRLERHEEIDHYVIRTARTVPITCDVAARRLGGEFNVVLEVRDDAGRVVADVADTRGHDAVLVFIAEKNRDYSVGLRELDFRGNRSYVYRLSVSEGPRVVASMSGGGRTGEQQNLQLTGFGLDGQSSRLSNINRLITFPNKVPTWNLSSVSTIQLSEGELGYETASSLAVSEDAERQILNSPFKYADVRLSEPSVPANDHDRECRAAVFPQAAKGQRFLNVESLPAAVTGMFGASGDVHRVCFRATSGEPWAIRALARCEHLPLDLNLRLCDVDGKQLAENDDLPETLDAGLLWTAPSDGEYELAIADSSGTSQTPGAVYRLEVVRPRPDFRLRVPQKHNVVQGGSAELTFQAIREDGFAGPIHLSVTGLPAGMTGSDELIIPGYKNELKVPLSTAADVPSAASLVTVTGTATIDDREIKRTAGALTPHGLTQKMLVAVTMKPRIDISPIESDERTVHRGTTHLAPIETKRLEGFSAQATLQLDSVQSFKFRQGLLCPDVVVPAGAESVFFPCFVPHVCETLDAYRMLVVAVAPVPDVDGRIRHLLSRMPAPDNSIAITVEGALLRINPLVDEETGSIRAGEPFDVSVRISRSAKLTVPLTLEAYASDDRAKKWAAVDVDSDTSELELRIVPPPELSSDGIVDLVICATARLPAEIPELDDVSHATPMPSEMVEILRNGHLPVMADARVTLNVVDR